MSRTLKVVIAALVVVALAAAALFVLNTSGGWKHEQHEVPGPNQMDAPNGDHWEFDRQAAPIAMVSNVVGERRGERGCNKECLKRKNRIAYRRHRQHPVSVARMEKQMLGRGGTIGCKGISDSWIHFSAGDLMLYRITLTVKWCWNAKGQFTAYDTSKGWDRGNGWWVLWKITDWNEDIHGSGPYHQHYRYRYIRIVGHAEACIAGPLGGCWVHEEPWISEGVRTNGTNLADTGVG